MRALAIALLLSSAVGCSNNTDVQRLPIGSPCTTSGDCGTGKFFCATAAEGHPNGYCKKDCKVDADCPSGSVCAGAGTVSSGECHKVCTQLSDCRASEGYICKLMPDDASHAYCDAPEKTSGDGGA
jgi:hypothetical protein